MDENDQTQIRSLGGPDSKPLQGLPPQPAAPDFDRASTAQAAGRPPLSTADILAEQTRVLPPVQPKQPRPSRQPARPPVAPPQPIRFIERESENGPGEEEVEVLLIPTAPMRKRPVRFGRTRRWLRSRVGRVVVPLVTLLLGLVLGLTSVIWYGLSGEGSLVAVVPAASGNLIVDANKSFVTQLVSSNIQNAGLPGKVQNISVTLKHGASMVVQGDDVYPVFFVNVTKHFTIDIQPYVQTCILQVRITHADLSGIPVTTFAQTFQSKINQQLAKKPTGLPSNFNYCTVGVSTEPGGMYITYQAIPVTQK